MAVVMTWPLARHLTSHLPSDLGDPLLVASLLAWGAARLPHGLAGWWSAPIVYPYHYTLAFSEHFLGIVLFTAPLQWITGNPLVAYNVAFIGAFALAGAGMYALARELGLDPASAVLAGLAFAFTPYRAGQLSHLQVMMSGWLPLCLCALHRYIRLGLARDLVALVVAFVLQALSNGYYLFFMTLPMALIVAAAAIDGRLSLRRFRALAAAGVCAALTVAPVLYGYLAARRLYGFHRSPDELRTFSADVVSYLGMEAPGSRPWPAERHLWIGAAAFALALVGAAVPFANRSGSAWRRARPLAAASLAALLLVSGYLGHVVAATVLASALALALLIPMPRRAEGLYVVIGAAAALLSFGPVPTFVGRRILLAGPYGWLYDVVPGFDGLRVVARFGIVTHLALAFLAGTGAAAILRRAGRWRTFAAAILAAGVLAATRPPIALAFVGSHGRPPDADVYTWLARQPEGAVLELPIESAAGTTATSFEYDYATAFHHHPIVNGATGYASALQDFLGGSASPLWDPDRPLDAIAMLQSLRIKYVLVHDAGWPAGRTAADAVAVFRAAAGRVRSFTRMGSTTVVLIEDPNRSEEPDAHGVPIPLTSFTAAASDLSDHLRFAFDDDEETRWYSGRPQRGDEWIALRFDRPRDVSAIRFDVHPRSLADYPRELTIESIRADGTTERLLSESPLAPLGRGFLEMRTTIPLRIDVPGNASATLRIRQTANPHRPYFWSVDQLRVYERSAAKTDR